MYVPKFFRLIAPAAQAGMKRTGIRASLIMALAFKLSKYGRTPMVQEYNSLFRLPADASWKGPTGSYKDYAWYRGHYVSTIVRIRAYGSWDECIEDYFDYLMEARVPTGAYRFRNLQDTPDVRTCLRRYLQDNPDMYPEYTNYLQTIIDRYGLEAYDTV